VPLRLAGQAFGADGIGIALEDAEAVTVTVAAVAVTWVV